MPILAVGQVFKRIMIKFRSTAQSFLEYALIISVVSAALVMMGLYVRRAVGSNLRLIEQQVNYEAVRVVK